MQRTPYVNVSESGLFLGRIGRLSAGKSMTRNSALTNHDYQPRYAYLSVGQASFAGSLECCRNTGGDGRRAGSQ
jgi:hypothetical protein